MTIDRKKNCQCLHTAWSSFVFLLYLEKIVQPLLHLHQYASDLKIVCKSWILIFAASFISLVLKYSGPTMKSEPLTPCVLEKK